jgi:release factor glutamine methyltransferase
MNRKQSLFHEYFWILRSRTAVLLGKLLHLRYKNKVCFLKYEGKSFIVLPEVFHPSHHWSGTYLAKFLAVKPGDHVLDMGTGSGIQAICSASVAEKVLACDLNPHAVKCATINAYLNDVSHKVEVRQSDLFENVKENEKFDLIVFNLPFFHINPRNIGEHAYFGGKDGKVMTTFYRDVGKHLKPGGKVQIIFSESAIPDMFEWDVYKQNNFKAELVVMKKSRLGHKVPIYLLSKNSDKS